MPEIDLHFGSRRISLSIDTPARNVQIAASKNSPPADSWQELAATALHDPLSAPSIRSQDLRDKRVAIITDDLARSTKVDEVLPLILDDLHAAGATRENITIVTASGMHDPLDSDGLSRKLGKEIVERYRCVAHDAGDAEHLAFIGITASGHPLWINRTVVEADYVVGVNRIYPHETHGYEGGYKLILPGVAGYDSIARNHSLNSEPDYGGRLDSPSRILTDEVASLIRIDLLINFVVNVDGKPVKAFAGEPDAVFQCGVSFGDREVWGADVESPADVVVASSGRGALFDGDIRTSWKGLLSLYRASRIVKPGGTVVWLSNVDTDTEFEPDGASGVADDDEIGAMSLQEFGAAIKLLSFAEIIRLHERRNWPLDRAGVMWRMRELRGEFLIRRRVQELSALRTVLTHNPSEVVRRAILENGSRDAKIVVLPEAATTLAKERLHKE